MTWLEICEYIAEYLKEAKGIEVTADDVWQYYYNEEMYKIHHLKAEADNYYRQQEETEEAIRQFHEQQDKQPKRMERMVLPAVEIERKLWVTLGEKEDKHEK